MARYKCPECGVIADIDIEQKVKRIVFPHLSSRREISFPSLGHTCELAKAISKIDFSKLEKV